MRCGHPTLGRFDSGAALSTRACRIAAQHRSPREDGATDTEIHDTVLIAAAFSMYNRYVDGLATWAPTDPAAYEEMGQRIVEHGYLRPTTPPM